MIRRVLKRLHAAGRTSRKPAGSFRPLLEALEDRSVPTAASGLAAPNTAALASAMVSSAPAAAAPISVPGGTVIRSTFVDVGTRRVVVAQVQVPGSATNNMRIYASVLSRTTGQSIRSNILISDYGTIGNHYVPSPAVTAGGQVVVAWTYVGLGGNNNRVLFRMIDPSAGILTTAVKQANSQASVTRTLGHASVSTHANGTFTVAWRDEATYALWAADFASNGVVIRPEYWFGYVSR
jgi:hypothetical protein